VEFTKHRHLVAGVVEKNHAAREGEMGQVSSETHRFVSYRK
jgi:RNase P/RNase MRP subunit p29